MNRQQGADLFRRVYGFAHFGKSLIWHSSELLFAFFLTEVCGLDAMRMGYTLVASLLVSGLVDFVVGKGLTRKVHSVASAAAWQLPAAMASGAAFLTFAATPLVHADDRFGFAIVSSLFFRLTYAFYDLPQNAILSLVRVDVEGRMRLAAVRFITSGIASLMVSAAAAPILIASDTGVRAARFFLYGASLMLISSIGALALRRVARTDGRSGDSWLPAATTASRPRMLYGRSSPFALSLALLFIVAAASAVFGKLEPYFTAQAFSNNVSRAIFLIAIGLGGVLGQPVWVRLAGRSSSSVAFRLCAVVMATGAIVLLSSASWSVSVVIGGMLVGCGSSGLAMLLWTEIAGIAASRHRAADAPAPVYAFGVVTCSIKCASAFAVWIVSYVLSHTDYRSATVAANWAVLSTMASAALVGAIACLFVPLCARRPRPRLRLRRPA